MNDWRTKIAALAVVLGLGGLGGYAMSENRRATPQASPSPVPTTQVIRRTVHKKPKHRRSATPSPGASAARSLTSAPVSSGSSGSSSSPPVSTGSSGSGGGAVHTGTSGSGGGESEGGGEHEGGGEGGEGGD
jgi:hypothetical protein